MRRTSGSASPAHTSDNPFIFISYARRDGRLVYPEIRRLQHDGYELWYDMESIPLSRDWVTETDKAIRECSCVVLFMTPGAVESEHVSHEIVQALEAKKPLIRIDWEKLDLPPQLQERVSHIQSLERYLLYQSEYEGRLRRSLSEHVGRPTRRTSAASASTIFLNRFLRGWSEMSPRKRRAFAVIYWCYATSVWALGMGAFFAIAASLIGPPLPEFNNTPRLLLGLLGAAPFLILATLLLLFGRYVQTLFARRHPPRQIRDLMSVGCLKIGSLGCGLWAVLSTCTVLVTGGVLLATGKQSSPGEILAALFTSFLMILMMLSAARLISEVSRHVKAENSRRAYRAYQDAVRPHLHEMAEPETRAFLQELTTEILGRLDATLKSTLLIFLGESGLLEGNARIVLDGADFSHINLASNSLPRTSLRGINFGQAMMEGCILFESDLRNAKLNNTELSYANLYGANLRQADLTGAVLEKTNLHDADLTEAKVTVAQLRWARLKNTVLPDGKVIASGLDFDKHLNG